MSDEERSLIQQTDVHTKKDNSIKLKYVMIIPAVLFLLVGGGIQTYVINEWTQYRIRTENFPNMSSVHNFSACSHSNHSDETYKHYKIVQQKSALWLAIYTTAHHIPMIFANIILPTLTDTRGRRFLFVITSLGMLFRYCMITIVIYFKLSFMFVAAAYALDGLTGSSYALYSSVFSYVADITTGDNQRVQGIVLMEIVIVISTVLSSLFSGYFIDTWNFGFFNTGLISIFIAYVGFFIFAFLVPESLNETYQKKSKSKSILATVKRSTQFYYSAEFKGKRTCYILLLLCFIFAELSETNRSTLETLYFLGQPFCWGPSQIGVFSMVRHASKGIIGLSVLHVFQRFMSNQVIAAISTLSTAGSYMIEAFATSTVMIYMVPVVGVLAVLLIPMIRGIMSAMTDNDKQGALFSSLSSIQVICNLISSYTANGIYAATFSFMNGFVFLVLASFCMIDFTLLLVYCCVKPYDAIQPNARTHYTQHSTNV
ncbi:lysosomal proton-coupled steroid conjugate and bile acid symporter SLC46A3-like [Ruditapes philippinarum]|uniref:lysosomal proton-coupled steroid conjugate and bile acid symporter SLC46A3-like n=1 Tax=Ruditapes philippinarum TaxID=129788 RepID=UPI00295BF822|nr:lysosomal proton-coupled steroid conjugate and bile acid symporter SLC46A3-like [Ruditapes philippinarum]